MKTLVLGGVRAGKSRFGEKLAIETSKSSQTPLIYIATSFPQDDEMQQRVIEHQKQRDKSGESWQTIEETLYLADQISQHKSTTVLVDCLTLWMTNLICSDNKQLLEQETNKLLELLPKINHSVIFVSNETGLGIVPTNQLSRQFVEKMGFFHQKLASACDQVYFVTAGLPMKLK